VGRAESAADRPARAARSGPLAAWRLPTGRGSWILKMPEQRMGHIVQGPAEALRRIRAQNCGNSSRKTFGRAIGRSRRRANEEVERQVETALKTKVLDKNLHERISEEYKQRLDRSLQNPIGRRDRCVMRAKLEEVVCTKSHTTPPKKKKLASAVARRLEPVDAGAVRADWKELPAGGAAGRPIAGVLHPGHRAGEDAHTARSSKIHRSAEISRRLRGNNRC